MSGGHSHSFHLVDPSPWPALGAMSGFVAAVGAIMFMHDKPFGVPIMSAWLVFILITMFFWWRDVIREAEHQGHHTPIVQIGMRYGMILFIASEVMFFLAFFRAFFDGSPTPDTGVCPPAGVETLDPFDIPLINTMGLLLSGCTCTWAHAALLENDRKNFILGLGVTVLLGAAFTGLQIYEYDHATFGFIDGIYSSTFYMATGFHGFHVLVGTCFLVVCWFRGRAGHFNPEHHFGFEAAAWYWHFVDVVWLFLFICIYWWGG